MKAVLISIQPKWCELIASGKKTVEVRKTKPNLETPFKVYIYCTNNGGTLHSAYDGLHYHQNYIGKNDSSCINGKVIGEFVCDRAETGILSKSYFVDSINIGYDQTCVSIDEVAKYLDVYGVCGVYEFYGWHISNLVIYDEPKALSEFRAECLGFLKPYKCDKCEYDYTESDESIGVYHQCGCDNLKPLKRPPQSWCYVETITEKGGAE